MGVGLPPLEFSECLADSPAFRENLQRHEKELERTSQQIKRLIKEVKDVVHAARRLSAAQLALADSMRQFEFACIGASMTEDERVISRSLATFADLMRTIEDERERMLGNAHEQIIEPLERFRKEHIGAVKESKKKFDKKTAKFCQSQERTLSLSTKKPDNVFQEADAALEMAERDLCAASASYVCQLQAVQERKKFELVETLLGFVLGWWTFHHSAHDVRHDAEPRVRDLQLRIQRTRTNFEETSKQTESLMKKMMEMRQINIEEECSDDGATRSGYLFLMEKKAFGTTWSKQYATYDKSSRVLTLLPYNQINVKAYSGAGDALSTVVCGARRASDTERRHCFEVLPAPAPAGGAGGGGGGEAAALLLQALSARQRHAWLRALTNGQAMEAPSVPSPTAAGAGGAGGAAAEETFDLDENGFVFVRLIISTLEARGLTEQGLYRVAGVSSKVSRLVRLASRPAQLPSLADPCAWESRTLTSALKGYLRQLREPLTTTRVQPRLIEAAKRESVSERVSAVHALIHALPRPNFDMLQIVIRHLCNVTAQSDKNLMTVSNLAVCFGPTLLRAERETVASILEIKFYNVIVETLLDHYELVFLQPPPPPAPPAAAPAGPGPHQNGHVRTSPGLPLSSGRPDLPPAMGPWLTSPAPAPAGACEGGAAAGAGARYSLHQHTLLQQLAPPPPPPPPHHRPPPPALLALRGAVRSSSSSAESVSSGSPPPPHHHPAHPALTGYRPPNNRYTRVRTLYACLGESEGELSFEPNQIVTNVCASGEPGWLRGTLNGRQGLVPENYVEPLP